MLKTFGQTQMYLMWKINRRRIFTITPDMHR